MRRALGVLLLTTLLLAGCSDDGDSGDGDGQQAGDPATSNPSSGDPTESPSTTSPSNDWRLVGIVHATAVGGKVSAKPKPVGDDSAIAAFGARFEDSQLQGEIQRVVESNEPAAGAELVAAVVSIGCDVPTAVTYDGGKVRAMKVPNPTPECFAPVTSVAILEVPAEG
jgi:hypothetical protein